MAPYPVRQLLVWSLPSIAVLLSYLWYKKRRIGLQSDGGENNKHFDSAVKEKEALNRNSVGSPGKGEHFGVGSGKVVECSTPIATPAKTKINRSLSGVESAPIDIVYPPELRSSKSTPIVISDEDLDLEIEKFKSIRNGYSTSCTITATIKTPSPSKKQQPFQLSNSICEDNNSAEIIIVTEEVDGGCTVANTATESEDFSSVATNTTAVEQSTDGNNSTTTASEQDTTPEKGVDTEVVSPKRTTPVNNKSPIHNSSRRNSGKTRKFHHLKRMGQRERYPISSSATDAVDDAVVLKKDRHGNNIQKQNSSNNGRDSANHSPSDVMLASPCLSSISDNHSEGSSDSGKGCSDVATPPPSRTPSSSVCGASSNPILYYEFLIPQTLVGKLIGKQGFFVQQIKQKAKAHVVIRDHPSNDNMKICSLEGNQSNIDAALKMIRDKFPLKKYSDVTLEAITFTELVPTVPLVPDHLYLKLVDGINNDTILSCMVTPNHLFMQQPTHPSFPNLNVLKTYMNACYGEADSPLLPKPIPDNTVCAAFSVDGWHRAMVLSSDEATETAYVKFLDCGGYAYIENINLRQIRQDFMLLPFQAAECILSNVRSISEDGTWPQEAYDLVVSIASGSIIYTQIADYTEEGIPMVLCYVITGHKTVIFLNQRLVDEGFAVWVPFDDTQEDATTPTTTNTSSTVSQQQVAIET